MLQSLIKILYERFKTRKKIVFQTWNWNFLFTDEIVELRDHKSKSIIITITFFKKRKQNFVTEGDNFEQNFL